MNDTLFIHFLTCASIGIYSCNIDIMSFIVNFTSYGAFFCPVCIHVNIEMRRILILMKRLLALRLVLLFVGGYICVVLCGFYGCWTAETTPCVHATAIEWSHSRLRKPSSPILCHQVRCLSKIVFGFNKRLILMEGNWMG